MKPIVHLRTLYDVQQLLKRFDVFVYVGKRLWDIELMALEIDNLYQAGVIDRDLFLQAKLVLKREHRNERKMAKERKKLYGNKE
ncbi:MAG TPA: YqgQ family protein [Candidatus Limosilactobacillus excrementigallinarum]|nr:YqgQ family protein [Candidatus Limosilactobacillus excrementigallinarum]